LWGKEKLSKTQVVQIDEKTKKLLRLVKISARLSKDKENFSKALKELAKSIPKETRSVVARYTASLRKAIKDPTPENIREVGELLIQKHQEIRSWRVENSEKRKIVSELAKRFYASLNEVSRISKELEKEFEQELVGVE
jgi:NifB/MoaA-like Fe-S oxidoreductase